jgi:hypothetical protein
MMPVAFMANAIWGEYVESSGIATDYGVILGKKGTGRADE